MYTPEIFLLNDPAEVDRILREYGFGLLVTAAEGAPVASHLPFLFDAERGPKGALLCHMARASISRL